MKTLLVAVALLTTTLAQAAPSAKISAKVAAAFNPDVIVRFKDRADLSYAAMIPQREARLRFVFESLKATALASQAKAVELLNAEGVAYDSFYIENAIHVPSASKELLGKLAALAQTEAIVPNQKLQLPLLPASLQAGVLDEPRGEPADNIKAVGADKVWAETGKRGDGIVIAGNDTGFAWEHPALKNQYRGNTALGVTHAYEWHDSIHETGSRCGKDSAFPCDDDMHGTHTMGTMLGDDGAANLIGVAPNAKWIGCRNMNAGAGTAATYLECFQFFLAPYPMGGNAMNDGKPELAPHIINNSWGCPPSEGCSGNEFLETVRALKAAGILVVAAVGNDGPSCGTIGMPPGGYSGEVLGVAAYNHRNGAIAGFSSRGPSTFNNGIGVDIAAPGVNVRSSVPGGGYSMASGTSMASPHMAGVAALLWSARPELVGKIDETIALLKRTAKPTTSTQSCGDFPGSAVPNAVFGSGLVDVHAAVNAQ